MLEYGLRFLAGGIAVSAFAALGDSLRPKSFAGLFGAAPSIALATLLITLSHKGAPFAAMEGRSMIVGREPPVDVSLTHGVVSHSRTPGSRSSGGFMIPTTPCPPECMWTCRTSTVCLLPRR
jgi:hypothetical protein